MAIKAVNAVSAPKPAGGYSQAVEVSSTTHRLYISGQIPETRDGRTPAKFKEQAELVWNNVIAQLRAADMGVEHLVKVTTFLSDRKYNLENKEARQAALGSSSPALTVIITDIFDENWLLEIEAIAER